jgi:hypothetical protein
MVNWLLSLAYASVFFRIFRHRIHSKLPFFMATAAFSSLYSVAFDQAVNWSSVSVPMAILRFLALAEAIYRVWSDKTRSRLLSLHCALQATLALIQLATLSTYPLMTTHPIWDGKHWGYPTWEIGSRVYAFACLAVLVAYHHALSGSAAEEAAAEGAGLRLVAADRSAELD